MKPRVLLAIGLLCLLWSFFATADTIVEYSTSGSFNGGASSITFGSGANTATISFTGVGSSPLLAPTFASLGAFVTNATGKGVSSIPITNFVLAIVQTSPSSASGTLNSTVLKGTLRPKQSTVVITFSSVTVTLGGVMYTLLSPNPVQLVPPFQVGRTMMPGITTLQALIVPPVVPEPATLLLMGSGLACMAGARKRFLQPPG